MKRFCAFFILIVFSFWLNVANAQVVNMPDANLAAAVREALGLGPGAPITRQALQGLEILIAQRSQIEDLTGLEHAPQLKVLDLFDNELSDIRPLAGLTQLRELILASFELSDIRPLAKLTQLRSLVILGEIRDITPLAGLTQLLDLNLNSNEIRDITPLAGLTQLMSLALTGNLLTDIRPLTGLTQLWRLYLSKNEIRDITPLAKLTQLRTLILRDNLLTDIRPLTGLTQLVLLRLGNNQITNVSALTKLPKLEWLYLEGNPIQDMSPLRTLLKQNPNLQIDIDVSEQPPPELVEVVLIPDANLAAAIRKALGLGRNAPITQQAIQKLTELDARKSKIKQLTGLEHATRLRQLELRENQIRDITPLANLKSLKHLILESNPVSNIRALAGLKQLTGLILGGHAISDFTPLKNLTELERLSLWGSNISDVTLLAAMTNLKYLWLGDNNISDITPLANLTQLKVLELRDNRIRNINPLVGLKNLEELSVRGNPITDKSPLRMLKNRNPNLKLDIEIPPLSPVVHIGAAERPPIYWVGAITGTLHRLVGDEVENLVPNVKNATSLAVDMAGGKLYWAEKTSERTGRIRGANLDGTNVKLVKNLTSVPYSITLDTINGKLYVTNAWGKIQCLNVDGSNFQSNLVTGLETPRNLVLDVARGKVYWTEMTEESGRIRRANLNGSSIQNVATGLSVEAPLTLAVASGTLYWTEGTGGTAGKLQRAEHDGTNSEVLTMLPIAPTSIAIDTVRNALYLTLPTGEIQRRDLNGSGEQPVVTGLVSPSTIVLDIPATAPAPPDTTAPPETPVVDAAADVNQDKKVNKTDLLLVVTALGETPPANPNFDVNADGTVNIADVLLVIEVLDDPVAAAAPSFGEMVTSLDPTRLAMQIDILRAESDDSLKYEQAIAFLQGLLASIRPTETQLLANYPNPFNPETWIPYQLAQDSDVRIGIYDARGSVVRVLTLGHQSAGYYTSSSRAAYWDGRNALGERVASGVYFYQLQTDTFSALSALRRMVILK